MEVVPSEDPPAEELLAELFETVELRVAGSFVGRETALVFKLPDPEAFSKFPWLPPLPILIPSS